MNMIAYTILGVMEHDALGFAVLCQLMRLNNHGVKIPRMMIDDWKPESECSHAYCSGGMLSKSMVEGYGLRFMFTNCLPSTIICMLMMDHVIGEKLPEMRVVLRGDQDEITPQMFASEWFFTLFSYVISDNEALLRTWDLLLVDGYKAIFRVALAILKLSYPFIEGQEFPTKMRFLKSFTDDFFSHESDNKPGDNLIDTAYTFKITNKYLSTLATN